MRILLSAVLYIALACGANAAELADLRDGTLMKLNLHETPVDVPDVAFYGQDGAERRLSDDKGRVLLVNFWATWCAPCRKEMPALEALESEFGGENFAVFTIATGRNPPQAITRFFADNNLSKLPQKTDPKGALARSMGVFGLPVSVLIDADGKEIGRLSGDADWASDSARAIISALTGAN